MYQNTPIGIPACLINLLRRTCIALAVNCKLMTTNCKLSTSHRSTTPQMAGGGIQRANRCKSAISAPASEHPADTKCQFSAMLPHTCRAMQRIPVGHQPKPSRAISCRAKSTLLTTRYFFLISGRTREDISTNDCTKRFELTKTINRTWSSLCLRLAAA